MAGDPSLFMTLSARFDDGVGGAFAAFERGAERAGTRGQASLNKTAAAAGNVDRQLRAAAAGLAVFQGPLGGVASRLNGAAQLFQFTSKGIAASIGLLAGAGAGIAAASGIQQYQAKLVAATKSQQEFARAQAISLATARDTRSDLGETIQFYVRLSSATAGLGVSQQQLFTTISTINKSIQLSGAGTQEATAAMQQFSQAVGSATGLSGDEFKSLGENASQVLDTIARGLVKINAIPGFDGTRGALKKLGSEGKLTRDILLPAIAAMETEVNDRFSRMPVTIQQAVTQMRTSLTALVISAEETTGGLGKIAGGIQFLADNFRLIGGVATVAGVAIAGRFLGPLIATGLAAGKAATELAIATVALRAFGGSAAVAGVSIVSLRAGLTGLVGLLGGPWGIALTAAAGAAFAFATRQSEAEKAAKLMGVAEVDLAAKVRELTGATLAQNDALAKNIDLKSQRGRREAQDATAQAAESDFQARSALANALGLAGQFGGGQAFRDVGTSVLRGASAVEIERQLDVLEKRFPAAYTRFAKGLDAAADKVKITSAAVIAQRIKVGEATESILNSAFPLRGVQSATATAAKTKAQLDAEAKGVETAAERYRKAIADLEAKFPKIGKASAADQAAYTEQRRQIETTYQTEIDGIKAAKDAKAAAAKAEREARAAEKKDLRDILNQTNEYNRILERYERRIDPRNQADDDRRRLLELAQKDPKLDAAAGIARINEAQLVPLREALTLARQTADVQGLILAGREADAEVLQRAYDLLRAGLDASQIDLDLLGRIVTGERTRNREIERRNDLIEIQARAYGDVQRAVRDFIANPFDFANIARGLTNAFRNARADEISLKLFGNAEQDARDRMTGAVQANTGSLDDLRAAIVNMEATLRGGTAGGSSLFGAAIEESVKAIQSNPLGRGANDNIPASLGLGVAGSAVAVFAKVANDNVRTNRQLASAINDGGLQTVTARSRSRDLFGQSNTATRYNEVGAEFGRKLDKVFGTGSTSGGKGSLESAGSALGNVLEGIAAGQDANNLTKRLGIKAGGSSSGAGAGRDIGGAAGGAIGSAIGGPLGAAIGALAGNVLGGLVGSLFGGVTDRAFREVTSNAFGDVDAGRSRSRGKDQAANLDKATQLADSLASTIGSITSGLGATVQGGASLGEIGVYGGRFGFKGSFGDGGGAVQEFDTATGAIGAALRNAIDKNIITGLRQGTKNLLLASDDIERQLAKANKFESVFLDLRRRTDPTGAAVDELNKRFMDLANVFKEAGASADDYAKLQQLYDLERADALKTAGNATLESLRSYLTDLTTSASSGLSLRDRRAAALDAFNPFAADIAAGRSVDVNAYRTAAENLREVERELFGSTEQYFSRLDQITGLTRTAIAGQSNVTSIADALNFTSPAATTPITNGLASLQQTLLGQSQITNELLARIAANSDAGGGMNAVGYAYGQGNF
jgi:tape measure domain-containing protein